MSYNPWYKATLQLQALGTDLKFQIPQDVFSTLQIDEGTLLLLEHLPASTPTSILDMGCGYGALGLPVAARFPKAKMDMVDRDLLAVEWAGKNAESNHIKNTRVFASLGFRDLTPGSSYDWLLCNVPARIGRPFMKDLFETGQSLLNPQGEIRIVVIRDLGPVIESVATENNWQIIENARGPRHIIFSMAKDENFKPSMDKDNLYTHDSVRIGGDDGVQIDRPFDISGDSARLGGALPTLIDAFPRKAPNSAFFFRCGYGALPLLAKKLWPKAKVVAFDRDILATTFARENALKLKLADETLEFRECVDISRALKKGESFDFIAGELSTSAGQAVAEADLISIAQHLSPQGQALILTIEKLERTWVQAIANKRKFSISRLIARDGNVVLRLTR